MWFATFDYQYEKEPKPEMTQSKIDSTQEKVKYFLRNPELYGIGLRSECYSTFIFVQWLAYGLWHAFFVYMTTMWVVDGY